MLTQTILAENPQTAAFARVAMGVDDLDENIQYSISDVRIDEESVQEVIMPKPVRLDQCLSNFLEC